MRELSGRQQRLDKCWRDGADIIAARGHRAGVARWQWRCCTKPIKVRLPTPP